MANATCAVDDCPRAPRARGYCARHYQNLHQYGNPVPQHDRPLEERLREIGWTVTASGCWEWNGRRNEKEYGIFTARRLGYMHARVHRIMYEHFVGPIPDGLVLRHRCDNPPCVNPDHLEPGTCADNSADMVKRGRHYMRGRAECPNGHDLTIEGATKIVRRKRGTETACVECSRTRSREYARRARAKTRAALMALGDL